MRLEAKRVGESDGSHTWHFGDPVEYVLMPGEQPLWRAQLDAYLAGHGTTVAREVIFDTDVLREQFIADFGPI